MTPQLLLFDMTGTTRIADCPPRKRLRCNSLQVQCNSSERGSTPRSSRRGQEKERINNYYAHAHLFFTDERYLHHTAVLSTMKGRPQVASKPSHRPLILQPASRRHQTMGNDHQHNQKQSKTSAINEEYSGSPQRKRKKKTPR